MFYGAVQSADSENSKTELSDDGSPDTSSRDNEINPHSVLLNHNTWHINALKLLVIILVCAGHIIALHRLTARRGWPPD